MSPDDPTGERPKGPPKPSFNLPARPRATAAPSAAPAPAAPAPAPAVPAEPWATRDESTDPPTTFEAPPDDSTDASEPTMPFWSPAPDEPTRTFSPQGQQAAAPALATPPGPAAQGRGQRLAIGGLVALLAAAALVGVALVTRSGDDGSAVAEAGQSAPQSAGTGDAGDGSDAGESVDPDLAQSEPDPTVAQDPEPEPVDAGPSTATQARQGAIDALIRRHWNDRYDSSDAALADAYGMYTGPVLRRSGARARWIGEIQADGLTEMEIHDVSVPTVTSTSGRAVAHLRTVSDEGGCAEWTMRYRMTKLSGRWKIYDSTADRREC